MGWLEFDVWKSVAHTMLDKNSNKRHTSKPHSGLECVLFSGLLMSRPSHVRPRTSQVKF